MSLNRGQVYNGCFSGLHTMHVLEDGSELAEDGVIKPPFVETPETGHRLLANMICER